MHCHPSLSLSIPVPYQLIQNNTTPSQDTITRALSSGATILPTDVDLISASDIILSIVPPRDALATAQRFVSALSSCPAQGETEEGTPDGTTQGKAAVCFADLNAISPQSAKQIASLFSSLPSLRFIDGAILGGPPVSPSNPSPHPKQGESPPTSWTRPLIPTSGPISFSEILPHGIGIHLASVLNVRHISAEIGAASGLKMCYASLSKGYSAIAVQVVTTARRLGVLSDLEASLRELVPGGFERMERAVVGQAPKAYRWVREMEEISSTHGGEGGLGFMPEYIFRGAAEVFRTVAEDTVLGKEKTGKRERGVTAAEVADAVIDGLREKKKRKEEH